MKDFLPYLFNVQTEVVKTKDPDRREKFFTKLAWDTLECREAEKLFPDMLKCPVCLNNAFEDDGILVINHKNSKALRN